MVPIILEVMARVRVIHWKAGEAEPLLQTLRDAGFEVEYDESGEPRALSKAIRAQPPEAFVIDLSRIPSRGHAMTTWIHGQKRLRLIPIVFVNGEEEKIAKLRAQVPDGPFTNTAHVAAAVKKALRAAPKMPVVTSVTEQYQGRTVAQKLGIAEGGSVGVVDPPPGYLSALGVLPEGVEVEEDPDRPHPVTLWYVHDPDGLIAALRRMWSIALRTKLWLVWRKGSKAGLTQNLLREACREAGLVDYKICAVGGGWSGMLFTRKKA
jgi:CheY-like chemotaxis protein